MICFWTLPQYILRAAYLTSMHIMAHFIFLLSFFCCLFLATQSDIRSAYRRLTLLLHPDKNDVDMRDLAETAFREVVAAYEILSNPDKR